MLLSLGVVLPVLRLKFNRDTVFTFCQPPAFLQNYHNIIEFIVCSIDTITSLFPNEATDFSTVCVQ